VTCSSTADDCATCASGKEVDATSKSCVTSAGGGTGGGTGGAGGGTGGTGSGTCTGSTCDTTCGGNTNCGTTYCSAAACTKCSDDTHKVVVGVYPATGTTWPTAGTCTAADVCPAAHAGS